MRAWSWQKASLCVVVVGEGLEFSEGGSCLRPDCVLTISVGGRGGSFTAAPRWAPNVLTEIKSRLMLGWTIVRMGSMISYFRLVGILFRKNEEGVPKKRTLTLK